MYVKIFELILLLTLALISDYRTYKIKNEIVIVFIFAGLLTNIVYHGLGGVRQSLPGLVVTIVMLFPLFALRMLGAGDIKLLGAVGSIMGLPFAFYSTICSFLCGGLIGICILIINRNSGQRLKYLVIYLKTAVLMHQLPEYSDFKDKSAGDKFHFTYAVLPGVLVQLAVMIIK